MQKFIFSCLLSGIGLVAFAQSADTARVKSVKDYWPTYLLVGYNAVPLFNSLFYEAKTAQEVQAGIDFGNNLLMVDYGLQKTNRSDTSYQYTNKGHYFRVGVETNVIKNNALGNSLTFGLRFARSHFKDEMLVADKEYGFGQETVSRANDAVNGTWLEATMGLNVRVVNQVYFGYTIRYKIYKKVKGAQGLIPYDLPGFGLNENKSTVGFDYYIRWIIPFRKEEEPVE